MTMSRHAPLCVFTLVLTACSGGGGGGGAPAVLVQFSSETSTLTEAGSFDIAVELVLTTETLAEAVQCTVQDGGAGAADSSADYVPFTPVTIQFPAGASSGASQTVSVQALPDDFIEGLEDIVLSLSSELTPVGGSGLHTLFLSDEDLAQVQFVESTSATSSEDGGVLAAEVELTYDPSLSLANDISVEALVANSSDAKANLDLILNGPLNFAANTASGTRATLTMTLVNDEVPEVDEQAIIRLVANAAVEVDGGATHRFLVTDDDVSPDAFLATQSDASGDWFPVENGDELNFGTASITEDEDNSQHLQLINFGIEPLSVGSLVVSGTDERDFAVLLESYTLGRGSATAAVDLAFPYLESATPGPQGKLWLPNAEQIAALQEWHAVRLHGLTLTDGQAIVLELERLPSPLRQDTVLAIDGRHDAALLQHMRNNLSFWQGRVLGYADSEVLLSFSPYGSRGWIELSRAPEQRYELASLRQTGAEDDAGLCVLDQRHAQLAAGSQIELCAEPLAVPVTSTLRERGDADTQASFAEVRLALESDYQLYQVFGTQPRTTAYVTSLVSAVSARFLTDAQAVLSIAYLGIWTTASDPWDTPDSSGSTLDMLEEFRAAWAPGLGGSWPVVADVAHFLSGASLGGGIAYLDALCNIDYCFGVSANIDGLIDWDTFDGSQGGNTWDFVVFAHELGHNFGSRHTHDYCPPLDHCQGSCEGGTSCTVGTIMSYCHLCGGMANIELVFHSWNANVMREAIRSACFDDVSLEINEELQFLLSFRPLGEAGEKAASLSLSHDGRNTDSPFVLELSGNALE